MTKLILLVPVSSLMSFPGKNRKNLTGPHIGKFQGRSFLVLRRYNSTLTCEPARIILVHDCLLITRVARFLHYCSMTFWLYISRKYENKRNIW